MAFSGTDNIIAALGHCNRVRKVKLLGLVDWQLEQVLVAMQMPFPELTDLQLEQREELSLVDTAIPDSFVGGSAPRLRSFRLYGIPFPGLPKLLLSATHLVYLWLTNIPHSGYISPEVIVALLSVLSSLKCLTLGFRSPESCPDRETRPPPPSFIPALISLEFKGSIDYLEDLVTRIDTPQLDTMKIRFLNLMDFDTPRLAQFISRTPKLEKRHATLLFYDYMARIKLLPGTLEITISCRESNWQLSPSNRSVTPHCTHFLR